MLFSTCVNFKQIFLIKKVLKNSDFCSFFQINNTSFDFLENLKKILFRLKLKLLFCKKSKLFFVFNKIIKGPVYLIFYSLHFNFDFLYNLFIDFINENNPKFICFYFLVFKQFISLKYLNILKLNNGLTDFLNLINNLFFNFHIILSYAKKI